MPSAGARRPSRPARAISVLKSAAGIDVKKMYPAKAGYIPRDGRVDLGRASEGGRGLPQGRHDVRASASAPPADSIDTSGALFAAYGAELVDAKGNITVDIRRGDAGAGARQKLVKVLPPDAVSYDDASNNRALISGKSALIWNPPSAWAVAKRDAPQVAADCWTFSAPKGPKGRFVPYSQSFWGIWQFAQNKTAAKELIEYLMQREQVEPRCDSGGRLRHPAVRRHAGLQGLGRRRAAEGHGVQLPGAAVAPRRGEHPGLPGAARHRRADLSTRHLSDRCWPSCRAASRSSR